MDEISFLISEIKKKTIFSVNDFQVIFNTDLKTANNLESDDVLREYIRAVVHENLLKSSGIRNTDEITSIRRLDDIDDNKSYIALDIATSVNQGIEELHCLVTEQRICNDELSSEDSPSWNQDVLDVPSGPLLRWNSDMTNLLIEIRGEMDGDFEKAKYKFRLWEKVASKMNARLENVKITAKDCDDKWRNIVATYRKNIDKLKCLGDNSVRWEYFNAMDDVLKGTKYLQPGFHQSVVDCSLLQSFPAAKNCDADIRNEPYEIINVGAYSAMEEIEIDTDELLENSIISKTSCEEERIWSTEQCLTMLCWRHQAEDKFMGSLESQHRSWEELAARLNEKFIVDFSADEVAFVWNHCNLVYELNLENLKSRGVNSIKWKYFAVMDEIRGGTNEISEICIPKPGEQLLTEFRSIRLQNSYCLADDLLCDTNSMSFTASSTLNVIENTDSEDNVLSISSGVLWTKDLIRTLISAKKSVEQDIQKSKIPRKKLWWSVVRKFRAQRHVKISEEACEEKWRELVRIYQKHLAKALKNGVSSIRWPFFWKMHETSSCLVMDTHVRDVKRKVKLDGDAKRELKLISNSLPGNCSSSNGDDDSSSLNISNDSSNLAAAIHELQENQNKLLREIVDNQQKRIDQLHQEQLSIKSLLMQLLNKLS